MCTGPSRLELAQALQDRDEIEAARQGGSSEEELRDMLASMKEEAKQARTWHGGKKAGLEHNWSEQGKANVRAANLSKEGLARLAAARAKTVRDAETHRFTSKRAYAEKEANRGK